MNRRIHYIGQYSENVEFRNLRVFPSALTKMNYIISCFVRIGYDVEVFSPAETKNNFLSHFASLKISKNEKITIKYIDTFGCPNLIFRILSRIWTYLQIICYLFFSLKKDEIVLIYHNWIYRWPLRFVRLFKKLNIYFEVEEIFNAAWRKSAKAIKKEIAFVHCANGYILVNDLMKEKLSIKAPSLVCYGCYDINFKSFIKTCDNKIHIVYAGMIEGKTSDIYLAINILYYLPNNYCLDILGYGTDCNILNLESTIKEVNNILGRLAIIYHGCLEGTEYYSFLSKCHIGLCPRVLENCYSDFTFPSKILVYLGNNLIPVCTPIESLKKSSIKDYLIFSNEISPMSLAQAILKVDFNISSSFKRIMEDLDRKFCSKLENFFNY